MRKSGRLFCAVIAGILAGALVTALLGFPGLLRAQTERAAAMTLQQNLIPARGESPNAAPAPDVSILVHVNGRPQDGATVSPDGSVWYIPPDGEVTLPLVPGWYSFQAAYENRVITLPYEVRDGGDNRLVLDIGNAPQAPELTMLHAPKDTDSLIPLPIEGAAEVRAEGLPGGMKVVRTDGGFSLNIGGDQADFGFYHIALIASNEYGETTAHLGVMIPSVIISSRNPLIPIRTVEDLRDMRQNLSGSYYLMNDLDMSGVHDWTPIGSHEYPFTGIFDGGGHEITGFHAPEVITEGDNFSLFGIAKNAQIRSLIVRNPQITSVVPAREGNISFSCCVFAGSLTSSLIQNCASIGGVVAPSDNYASGIASLGNSIALGLFSSTDVICQTENRYLPNTGGLFFAVSGYTYAANCANEGDVFGRHLTGGIAGYNHMGEIVRSINSGYIWGSTLVGEFPPGGIMQTTDYGWARDCLFVRGMSAVGGKVFSPGVLGRLIPIDRADLRNAEVLSLIGEFTGDSPDWAFASLDANGPVPYFVFRQETSPPEMPTFGDTVLLPEAEGLRYFYTLDGSDPYTGNVLETGGLSLTLSRGQLLTVFAAKQGHRDSPIVRYSPKGGD